MAARGRGPGTRRTSERGILRKRSADVLAHGESAVRYNDLGAQAVIRRAGRDDAAALWPLLMAAHAEQGLFSLSPGKVSHTLNEAIDDGRVLVAEKDGALIGTFAWAVTTLHYSDDPFISDLWMAAIRLCNALKAKARTRNLPLVAAVFGKRTEGERLFGADFAKAGALFLMR